MRVYLKKTSYGLMPADEESANKIHKLKDDLILCEIKQGRNIKFHRKFFAFLNVVFDQQEKYSNIEDLRIEILLKAGQYDEHITTKGNLIYIPKSMKFNAMTEEDFKEFYSKSIDVALKYFCKGDKKDLENKIENILNFV